MNNDGEKIVKFDTYCKFCRYYEKKESCDQCHDCLQHPVNLYSHRPVRFEEK